MRRRRQRPQEVKDSTMALCLLHIGKLDLAEPFVTLSQLTITLKENEIHSKMKLRNVTSAQHLKAYFVIFEHLFGVELLAQ